MKKTVVTVVITLTVVAALAAAFLLGLSKNEGQKLAAPAAEKTDVPVVEETTTTTMVAETTTTTVPAPTTTTTVAPLPYDPALYAYCVNEAKKLYADRPDIGAGKDPAARCKKLLTEGGGATSDGKLVDRAGVDAEINYTRSYYDLMNVLSEPAAPTTTTTSAPACGPEQIGATNGTEFWRNTCNNQQATFDLIPMTDCAKLAQNAQYKSMTCEQAKNRDQSAFVSNHIGHCTMNATEWHYANGGMNCWNN